MTTVGHSLVGIAIGLAALPVQTSLRAKLGMLAACVVAANIPDLPFPGWGHDAYFHSHSMWVTMWGAGSLIALGFLARCWWHSIPLSLPFALALCWCSHIVLDSMYAGTPGLIVGWPYDKTRWAMPLPWLETADRSNYLMNWHNVRVIFIELATFGPLVVGAALLTRFRKQSAGGRSSAEPLPRNEAHL